MTGREEGSGVLDPVGDVLVGWFIKKLCFSNVPNPSLPPCLFPHITVKEVVGGTTVERVSRDRTTWFC
jgi:hypothetical protein